MLRQNDPVLHHVYRFWEYVEKMDDGRMRCRFCGHDFAKDTAITRIKFHLARVKGRGVRICGKVTQDVQDAALAAIPIDGPPEKKLETGAGSSNNEVTNAISASAQEQNNNEVIMDDVHNVVKEKTEPIASMLDQSNAILDKLSRDDGRIQVGVQGLEQGAEEELICLHPEAESGMENTSAEYIQHVDRNDSLEQTRLMESNSGRLVQPGTSASSTKLAGRASVKNAIWSCLMDDKVSIIGIYGMGGNGKTTMLRNICNELLERQDISHSIYWVNVPQDFRIDRSQDLIAKRLDLNLPSKDDDLCGVVELAKELMMKQKWILILNDLWNSFDPQEFGIPVPLNGSKFIMTTRSEMVCQQMNCQNSIRVDPLSDEEAWTLFMEKLGHDRQLSQEEQQIAKDAVRECAGLSLGIVTLAESLKGVHELHKWKITLKRLKESIFWEMEDQIFKILRLSYDCLDDSTKECFVYCALFDESQKIERRELIESFIEEGIIKEFDKGHSILDELENVCLLERIDGGKAVKMHDLLRDMAIQILDDEYSPDMNNEMMMAPQREDLSLDEDWMASITAEDMEPLVRGTKAFPLLFKPPLTSSSLMDTLGGVFVGASAAGVSTLPFDNGGNTIVFSLAASLLKINKGDITKWSVDGSSDAIVNPANERMLGGGGADGAIHRAAGPRLRDACYTVPEVRPGVRCPTGEARITPGFNLPASHVIHTVGPIYDVDGNPEASLRNAYRNCLTVAKDNNIKYIAFPAISCGVYGYPYKEAATVAISTVKEFAGDLKEVHFVLLMDEMYKVWMEKAKELLQA